MSTVNETMIKIQTTDAILDILDTFKPVSVAQARQMIAAFRDGMQGAVEDLAGEPERKPIPRGLDSIIDRGVMPHGTDKMFEGEE